MALYRTRASCGSIRQVATRLEILLIHAENVQRILLCALQLALDYRQRRFQYMGNGSKKRAALLCNSFSRRICSLRSSNAAESRLDSICRLCANTPISSVRLV